MSDSRLEKFIYAICSMDVSDLPVPLSRIEKLWNCLITGETPDFEPLSRNEKYLMAMLDRYDISNLPAPMSRGEKLLYKIAVGETDLSDVPGYLSRYEELLKYLIENGGIGFEYVLYTLNQSLSTLYNTAEKPVKSAILSGNTLVNLSENLNTITRSLDWWYREEKLVDNIEKLKRNTYYTVLYRLENISGNHQNYNWIALGIGNNAFDKDLPGIADALDKNGGWSKVRFKLTDEFIEQFPTYKQLHIRPIRRGTAPVEGESVDYTIRGFAILEGDYITNPIPFNEVFEGMQSVKMPVLTTTGKNLFNGTWEDGYTLNANGEKISTSGKRSISSFIEVNESFSIYSSPIVVFRCYDEHKNDLNGDSNSTPTSGLLSFKPNTKYIRVVVDTTNIDNKNNFMVVTSKEHLNTYEPYKSNILTVNEPIELRGIGDVKDTLDCLTGEVTQRIGEIVLDGSEEWTPYYGYVGEGNSAFVATIPSLNNKHNDRVNSIINDKFISGSWFDYADNPNYEIAWNHDPNKIGIRVKSERASDVAGFKAFLSANNVKINYELATESIKTVDLTTVDQDGQPTKLKTYNDVTHVEIDATNIIPSVDLEVATKINETLSTMRLEHHDISETQNKLGQTIDEQTENTDATMMATTEIYENL